jgi:uncharacterized protein
MRRTLLITIVVILAACGGSETVRPRAVARFPDSDTSLRVRIADDDAERARGLMGLETLPADQGMAFVWTEPVEAAFWMKDTLIPLSIAFVDTQGRIVAIRDMEPCRGDPCPTYVADAPYVLAIEANRGFYAGSGIGVGDRALLEDADA